jgi:hypothetical protein
MPGTRKDGDQLDSREDAVLLQTLRAAIRVIEGGSGAASGARTSGGSSGLPGTRSVPPALPRDDAMARQELRDLQRWTESLLTRLQERLSATELSTLNAVDHVIGLEQSVKQTSGALETLSASVSSVTKIFTRRNVLVACALVAPGFVAYLTAASIGNRLDSITQLTFGDGGTPAVTNESLAAQVRNLEAETSQDRQDLGTLKSGLSETQTSIDTRLGTVSSKEVSPGDTGSHACISASTVCTGAIQEVSSYRFAAFNCDKPVGEGARVRALCVTAGRR